MNVHILLSSVGDIMPKHINEWTPEHHTLDTELRQNALRAWQERQPDVDTVRFMQKMPSQNGLHFRFFNVSQKSGKLLVSRA